MSSTLALAFLAGCAAPSQNAATTPRAPAWCPEEPIYMAGAWSGWIHQRGDSAESMPLGEFDSLADCQRGSVEAARATPELVDARRATYRCGRQCRRLHERFSSSPFVCVEDVEGAIREVRP